jgi:hypothetical protein
MEVFEISEYKLIQIMNHHYNNIRTDEFHLWQYNPFWAAEGLFTAEQSFRSAGWGSEAAQKAAPADPGRKKAYPPHHLVTIEDLLGEGCHGVIEI